MLILTFVISVDAELHERIRIWLVDQNRSRFFVKLRNDAGYLVSDSTRFREDADKLALVVRNSELPQRARMTARDDHDVRRMDVVYFAPHEAAASVDDDVVGVNRRGVLEHVFAARERR